MSEYDNQGEWVSVEYTVVREGYRSVLHSEEKKMKINHLYRIGEEAIRLKKAHANAYVIIKLSGKEK